MKPLMFARLGAACLVVASAWLPRFVSASHRDVLDQQKPDPKAAPADPGFHFTDVTAAAGIRFRHNSGAFGKKYLPETLGSGVAFLDFDNDGWQDLFYVNSMNWPGHPGQAVVSRRSIATTTTARSPTSRGRPALPSRCTASASRPRISTTTATSTSTSRASGRTICSGIRRREIRRRDGQGRRRRPGVLHERGVVRLRSGRQARSLRGELRAMDDRDRPDVHARRAEQIVLHARVVQGPELDALSQPRRRHVRGRDPKSRALRSDVARRSASRCSTTTTTAGWISSSPTTRSPTGCTGTRGDGTFADVGMTAGVAFNEAGVARAGMGVDAADYDGSGRPSLIIGNFSNEMMALYSNEGNGLFIDEAPDVHDRQGLAADADVRLLLLRRRSRRPARHLRRQRPRRRRHQHASSRRSPTRSRRTCSGTSAAKRFEEISTRVGRGAASRRSSRAAPPTATSTTTATSTC